MNRPALIKAIMDDAANAVKFPNTRTEVGNLYSKVKAGPQELYENFRTKVVSDAEASANALRNRQIALGAGDNYQAIKRKDQDDVKAIAELINEKPADLLNFNPTDRSKAAIDAAIKGIADNSLRGIRRRGAEWVAANPDTAIPVGISAAAAGGTALLTASGQALAALTNNMTQALKTEEKRDNVLTS